MLLRRITQLELTAVGNMLSSRKISELKVKCLLEKVQQLPSKIDLGLNPITEFRLASGKS